MEKSKTTAWAGSGGPRVAEWKTSRNIVAKRKAGGFLHSNPVPWQYLTETVIIVRELIREDQERRAKERLETLLLEGLNSGESIPADAAFWSELKREAVTRLVATKKSGK